MKKALAQKLRLFYLTSIFGVLFAVIGFSYNAWRLELTEDNSNIRTAAFEVLLQLSEFEQIIYALHYDQNEVEGSPRKGWVKVGLVQDLSVLIGPACEKQAVLLKQLWAKNWQRIDEDESVVQELVAQIDVLRGVIQVRIKGLD